MCLLRYFHRDDVMHTRASLMHTELNMYSEQEQNSSIMTANAYRNPDMPMWRLIWIRYRDSPTDKLPHPRTIPYIVTVLHVISPRTGIVSKKWTGPDMFRPTSLVAMSLLSCRVARVRLCISNSSPSNKCGKCPGVELVLVEPRNEYLGAGGNYFEESHCFRMNRRSLEMWVFSWRRPSLTSPRPGSRPQKPSAVSSGASSRPLTRPTWISTALLLKLGRTTVQAKWRSGPGTCPSSWAPSSMTNGRRLTAWPRAPLPWHRSQERWCPFSLLCRFPSCAEERGWRSTDDPPLWNPKPPTPPQWKTYLPLFRGAKLPIQLTGAVSSYLSPPRTGIVSKGWTGKFEFSVVIYCLVGSQECVCGKQPSINVNKCGRYPKSIKLQLNTVGLTIWAPAVFITTWSLVWLIHVTYTVNLNNVD